MTISVKYKLVVFIILMIMVGIYHAGCSSGNGNDAPVTVKAEKNKKRQEKSMYPESIASSTVPSRHIPLIPFILLMKAGRRFI